MLFSSIQDLVVPASHRRQNHPRTVETYLGIYDNEPECVDDKGKRTIFTAPGINSGADGNSV